MLFGTPHTVLPAPLLVLPAGNKGGCGALAGVSLSASCCAQPRPLRGRSSSCCWVASAHCQSSIPPPAQRHVSRRTSPSAALWAQPAHHAAVVIGPAQLSEARCWGGLPQLQDVQPVRSWRTCHLWQGEVRHWHLLSGAILPHATNWVVAISVAAAGTASQDVADVAGLMKGRWSSCLRPLAWRAYEETRAGGGDRLTRISC